MSFGGAGVYFLNGDSIARRRPEENAVIEIHDTSSESDSNQQPPARNATNEVICVDDTTSSEDAAPNNSQQSMQPKSAMRTRVSDDSSRHHRMNGKTTRSPSSASIRSFKSDATADSESDSEGRSDSSGASDNESSEGEESEYTSNDEWKQDGGSRQTVSTGSSKSKSNRPNGAKNGYSVSSTSVSSTSFTSTSYLSSIGGSAEDRHHPQNGQIKVRVRSADGKMIVTKRKPKSHHSSNSKKRARLETHFEEQCRRCPICFTRVPSDTFEKHKSTCGQDLIGEFQNGVYAHPEPVARASLYDDSEASTEESRLANNNSIKRQRIQSEYPAAATAATYKKKTEDSVRSEASSDKKQPAIRKSSRKVVPVYPASPAAKKEETTTEANHSHNTRGGTKRKSVPRRNRNDDRQWRKAVEDAIRDVRQRRRERQEEILKEALNAKNEMLSKSDLRPPTEIEFPVLNGASVSMECARLDDPDYPLPRDDFTTIFLKKHFHTDEKTDPSETDSKSPSKQGGEPYDEDATLSTAMSRDKIRFSAQIEEFNAEEKIGVGYEEHESDEEISQVLELIHDVPHDRDEVHGYLALLLQENVQRIKDHYNKALISGKPKPKRVDSNDPYKNAMSSFRDLFCRRCLTYDCNLHGLAEDNCAATQSELAVYKESSGYWKEKEPMMCFPVAAPEDPSSSEVKKCPPNAVAKKVKLTEAQKALCQKLFHIFQGDIDKVATAAGLPKDDIMRQAPLIPFQFTNMNPALMGEVRSRANKSNTYNPSWVKKIVETESHPFFYPCHHTGPCSENSCTCIKNGFFCTKHCIWGSVSRNFFKGCNCTAKCLAKSCPCFASNRECDPDLCRRCSACSDPPNQPATSQPCRNDNIGMRRHVHLLVGKSTVPGAGWGLFTKYALQKGDYIHEYLGEVIPQDEAEQRGAVYDEKNQTYLFDLTSDCAVDALRKGNKTRFINHSVTPNIYPRILVVNGDFRIGFFAKNDIKAQAELFFDYGKMFFSSKGSFAKRRTGSVGSGSTLKTEGT